MTAFADKSRTGRKSKTIRNRSFYAENGIGSRKGARRYQFLRDDELKFRMIFGGGLCEYLT
jgi:hypothetical protein